ncbi:glutamine amidotransferase-like class 1 domain-containing protein 3, mitochondrial [Ornithodoros turicata]
MLSSRARISLAGARFFTISTRLASQRVAVVLSGSGVYDGSEIHEATAILSHITRGGAEPVVYAPDINHVHVVNHLTGEPDKNEVRSVLVESARIARGKIQPLSQLNVADIDAVAFPGGFGAAKNLSSFAADGANCKVIPEIEKLIKSLHAAKKPMAFCCIAPVLAAKVLGKVEITLGLDKDDGSGRWPYSGAVEAVTSWGAVHHNRTVEGIVVDQKNRIVSTPAFMYDTPNFHEVVDGIGNMIKALLKLIGK